MKTLKVFVTSIFFLFSYSQVIFASDIGINPHSDLRLEIEKLVKPNDNAIIKAPQRAELIFTINKFGEIIVIDVETKNKRVAKFIKSQLNFKKTHLTNYVPGRKYFIGIRFV